MVYCPACAAPALVPISWEDFSEYIEKDRPYADMPKLSFSLGQPFSDSWFLLSFKNPNFSNRLISFFLYTYPYPDRRVYVP